MDIITRAEAGLPAPPSTLTRHSGSWPGITWHHTGGTYTTWRNIYNWQVINRPEGDRLPYIGYSYGISNGRVTELRGWNLRPAGDHDNDRLQVCFMGTWDSKLPPAADLAAAQEFLAWATARNGAPLPGTAHRDVWPAGHRYDTDCPGNALASWLKTMGDDVNLTDKLTLPADLMKQAGQTQTTATVGGALAYTLARSLLHDQALARLEAAVARLEAKPSADVDEAALAAELAPLLESGASAEEIAAAVAAKFAAKLGAVG